MALNNIFLNESGKFYIKQTEGFFSTYFMTNLFKEASIEKGTGHYLLNLKNQEAEDYPGEVRFSLCVFKFVSKPSFIAELRPNWEEVKLGFLLVIDYATHMVIVKKNITNVDSSLDEKLDTIDFRVLSTLFFEDSSSVEKMALNNTNTANNTVRNKSLEAENLINSYSTYGAAKYVPNSARINNNDNKVSISFNTSKITNLGDKKYVRDIIRWGYNIVDRIRNYVPRTTFFNVFAEPVDYESLKDELTPVSIFIYTSRIHEAIENGMINRFYYSRLGVEIPIPQRTILTVLSKSYRIEESLDELGNEKYYLKDLPLNDVEVVKNRKSITLKSAKLSSIYIEYNEGGSQRLLNFLNLTNDYSIYFQDIDLVYFSKKLFKDSRLLGEVTQFLAAFIPKVPLDTISSEKGIGYLPNSTSFPFDSIFHYIDTEVLNDSTYAFLDDLGDEWADFIKISNDKITFIHGKSADSIMSATDWHDVIAQALKNIGNFNPPVDKLNEGKLNHWQNNFRINNVQTQITRLRVGDSVANGINAYQRLLLNPNLQREIVLVVNFLSKSQLEDRILRLQNGEIFPERNQVIPILWEISGLINACMENSIQIHIHCKT